MTELKDIPGIAAAMKNDNITYMNLDVKDTSPVKTDGFTDAQIAEMSESHLEAQLQQIDQEEQSLLTLHADLNRRRSLTLNLIKRKREIT